MCITFESKKHVKISARNTYQMTCAFLEPIGLIRIS